MKKILFLSLLLIGISHISSTFAIMAPTYEVYDTREALETSGQLGVCSIVTDGCSEWNVVDGVIGDGIKACKVSVDFKFQWTCLTGNPDIMYMTDSAPISVLLNGLTTDEQYFLDTYTERIGKISFMRIERLLEKYTKKLALFPLSRQAALNSRVIEKLQSKITVFLMIFPQDIVIPKKDNHTYMMMEVLKFKLKILQYTLDNRDPIVYTCDDKKTSLTVYRKDYAIDDMAFQVATDEIHISDGLFLLPNYVATREVSASGEKFVGKNTETKAKVTFWFKSKEVSFYEGEKLTLTCTEK